jgi:hypothetical protein
MKPRLSLSFADFWPGFVPASSYFVRTLATRFQVELDERPQYLLYSVFGHAHRDHRGIRIFYTGENVRPDFAACDYALGFEHLAHPRYCRLPLYVLFLEGHPELLVKPPGFDAESVLRQKTKFCSFVYSNPRARRRLRFFEKLSRYKPVDAGGALRNNVGGKVADKLAFLRDYKFTIAFENSSAPGYTTEKLIDAMRVHSLAIYWGNPEVHRDFNPRSFLNAHEFPSDDALIERIMELDRDDKRYLEYLRQPYFHDNQSNRYCRPEHLLDFFSRIVEDRRTPVAQQPWLTRLPAALGAGLRGLKDRWRRR